jgi:filamentous hemagglutinin family protein
MADQRERPAAWSGSRRVNHCPAAAGLRERRAGLCGGSSALALILAWGAAQTSAPAQQLPTGGTVTAGNASIGAPQSGTLTVNQTSSQAIINWQSFSVGQGGTVNFNQPGTSAATLNRVTGSVGSTIAGTINAPGTVLLVNPNGIAITPTGVINTGAFAASTLDIKDSDFLAGKYRFSGNGASAGVTNTGRINVSDGGFAALLGGQVENSGIISARLGKVALGSGELITLDLSGDGFLSVGVPSNQLGKMVDGSGQALVTNSGKIRADGGQVYLSAATAAGILRDAVNVPGSISARTVGSYGGRIVIGGGAGGRISVTGRVSANGGRRHGGGSIAISGAAVKATGRITADGRSGGEVRLSAADALAVSGTIRAAAGDGVGGRIDITSRDLAATGAVIDASGGAGGGTVNIGGEAKGGGTLAHALAVSLDAATEIRADAGSIGNGGQLTVWSDGLTRVSATLTARGGSSGGDGGQIETSGHSVDFAGIRVDASAAKGKGGLWLVDPTDLAVDAAAAASINATLGNGTGVALQTNADGTTSGPGTPSSGTGDIIVNAPLAWATSSALTLDAFHGVSINAPVSLSTGTLSLTARGAGVNIAAPVSVTGAGSVVVSAQPISGISASGLTFGNRASIDYGATDQRGSFALNGQSYSLVYGMPGVEAITNNQGSNFALATNLDASGKSYSAAVIPGFSGMLDGLGHTISGLTITGTSSDVGLIGISTGNVSNLGLVGGSVSGDVHVAALVGTNSGRVQTSYATGAVSGNSYVGGVVGLNYNGTVQASFATGPVSGSSNYVGGLVGYGFFGTVRSSYATGAVSGGSSVGGLIGANSGAVLASYWDTVTSGRTTSAGGTGLTTAQLQTGGLPGGFDAGVWGGGTGGIYPYLKTFFPNGVQAISGAAYKDAGTTPLASGASGANFVSALADGQSLGTATTGANGYYYIPVAAGTIGNGAGVIAYTEANPQTGAQNGIGFSTAATAGAITAVPGLNIFGGYTLSSTPKATWSGLAASLPGVEAAFDQAAGANPTVAAMRPGLTRAYLATGGNFTFDQPLSLSNGLYLRATSGNVTVAKPIAVNGASALTLAADAGAVAVNASVSVTGAGSVAISARALPRISTTGLTFGNGASIDYGAIDQGGRFALNGQSYTLIYGMPGVEAISANQGSGYALATNIDASGMSYSGAVIPGFSGMLDGLGHTISGLTITGTSSDVGLIGISTGNVSNLGLVGSRVSGDVHVGALVGTNSGRVQTSYATGAVSGNSYVGGLVGLNYNGTVQASFASTAVAGSADYVGGLVGYGFFGSVYSSYATGAVSGSSSVGGLIGANTGAVLSSYWDTVTSGRATSAGGTGLTTAQLQTGGLPVGFDAGAWGGGTGGIYPYLKIFFPNGVQTVSGIAYRDAGTTPLVSGASGASFVTALANGRSLGTVTTGANGYYYVPMAAGTIATTGSQVVAYSSGATGGATFQENATGSLAGLNIYGTYLKEQTTAATLSTVSADRATALGQTVLPGYANRRIEIGAPSFVIDQPITATGTVLLSGTGAVTQSAPITARNLVLLGSGASYGLTGGTNSIGILSANTGSIDVAAKGNLLLGTAGGIAGVTTSGRASVVTDGDLTIHTSARVAAGADIVLAAGGRFVNNRGSDAVAASGGGRWLIYSNAPGNDNFGGLDSANTAIWNATSATVPAAGVSASGNRYLFAAQPMLTVTSTDVTKTYGDDATAAVAAAYVVSGLQGGVTGAFLGDSAESVYSGAPSVTSAGAASGADVAGGPYAINASTGSLTLLNRYGLAFNNAGRMTVAPAPINVTALGGSSIYGDAPGNPGLSATGLKNGQDVSALTGLGSTFAVTNLSNVGGYAVDVTGTNTNANYVVTGTHSGAWTVTPAPVVVTALGGNSVYGDAPGNPGLSATGLKNGQDVSALTGLGSTFAVTNLSNVGGYAVDVTGTNTNANYVVTGTHSGAWTVTPAPVVVTALGGSSVYGDTPGNPGLAATGLKNGQDASVLTGLANSFGITNLTNAGSYALTVDGALTNPNYVVVAADTGAWKVTPAPITVTALGGNSIYGDTPNNPGFSATGLRNGQDVSVLTGLTNSFGITSLTDAGSHTLNVGGTLSNPNYTVTGTDNGAWTVTPAPITVTAPGGNSIYGDAPSNPGLTATGLRNGQDVSVLTGLGNSFGITSLTNAGSTVLKVDGTLTNSNYTVTATTNGTWTVDPAPVTVTALGGNSIYGDAPGNPGLSARGLRNGQDVTVLTGLGTTFGITSLTSAGSYAVDVTGTNTNANYVVTGTGSGSWTVAPASVVVTALGGSSVYGDMPDNPGLSASGLKNGQDVSVLTGLTNTFGITNLTDAGRHALNVAGTLTNPNYVVAAANTGAWTVTPAPISVTALGGRSTYGDTPGNPGLAASGLRNGQDVSVLTGLANTFGVTSLTDAGSHTLNVGGTLANSNYTVAAASSGSWTVDPAPISVTALGGRSIYGDAANNPGLSAAGLKNGQDVSVLTGLANTFGITSLTDAGSYTLSVGGTLINPNYTVTAASSGTWMVDPAPTTVTALGGRSTYGDAPSNPGLSATGMKNGQDVGVLTGLANTFGITSLTNAGSYAVDVTGTNTNANYVIAKTHSGSWTVTPAPVTVTAVGGSSVYGDMPSNPGLSAIGLRNGQDVTVLTGLSNSFGVTGATHAGTATLAAAGVLSNPNYAVSAMTDGTWTVLPRPVTVAADPRAKTPGMPDPPLTFHALNLVNGDTLNGALSRRAGEAPGAYPILQGTVTHAVNPDYAITFVGSTLTIAFNGNAASQSVPAPPSAGAPATVIAFEPPAPAPVVIPVVPSGGSGSEGETTGSGRRHTPSVARTDTGPSDNPDTGSIGAGDAAWGRHSRFVFQPISQYDPKQYAGGVLPDYHERGSLAAVFTMIARALSTAGTPPTIDGFWRNDRAIWAGDSVVAGRVSFSGGARQGGGPDGDAAAAIEPGRTDINALLKSGPVIIGGAGHWLLATGFVDGKGIVACDPISGRYVILAYDAGARTVGSVTAIFAPHAEGWIPIADAGTIRRTDEIALPDSAVRRLQAFTPSVYLAVSLK